MRRRVSGVAAAWLVLGPYGAEEEVRAFALAFRALPAVPFTDLRVRRGDRQR